MEIIKEYPVRSKQCRKVRRYRFRGITLGQALLFDNDEWCDAFFRSFRDMNHKYPHKMLYLKWDVHKSNFNGPVIWELISAGKTGYKFPEAKNVFNDGRYQKNNRPTSRRTKDARGKGFRSEEEESGDDLARRGI